jgi:hypothetical protein
MKFEIDFVAYSMDREIDTILVAIFTQAKKK